MTNNNISKKTILLIKISFIAFAIRIIFINVVGYDYEFFLRIWINEISLNPLIPNIDISHCNYTSLYVMFLRFVALFEDDFTRLIIIKYLSFIFDYLCAIMAYKIISVISDNESHSIWGFALTLFMPTIFLNSSYLTQCDSIYVFFLLWSFYCILIKKYNLSIVVYAIACCLKIQSIFFLPVIGYIFFLKKIKFRQLMVIPLLFTVSTLPDIILSKSLAPLFMYLKQTNGGGRIVYNTMNIYQIINIIFPNTIFAMDIDYQFLPYIGVIIVFLTTLLFLILYKKYNILIEPLKYLEITLFFAIFIPFFLPYMHERYYFFAEILIVIYLCCKNFKRPILLCIPLFSLFHYILLIGSEISLTPLILIFFIIEVVSVANIIFALAKEIFNVRSQK